jgi:hypothetical protein
MEGPSRIPNSKKFHPPLFSLEGKTTEPLGYMLPHLIGHKGFEFLMVLVTFFGLGKYQGHEFVVT